MQLSAIQNRNLIYRIFYMQQATKQAGFSVLEILIVIAILAILISIAIPAYENYQDHKNITQAKADVLEIQVIIDRFYITNNRFPNDLSEINENVRRDPWGNNYYYTNISTVKNKGSVRKDKNLTPVNSDYDLYSAGKDRLTSLAFTAKHFKSCLVTIDKFVVLY